MHNLNRIRHQILIFTQRYQEPVQAFYKYLTKIKMHLFILLFMFFYLAFAPRLYTKYFIKLGKPTDLKINLPAASPLINFNIETSRETLFSNHKVFHIGGWSFLENVTDQSIYEKYLVLNSRDRVYYFRFEEVLREDVSKFFKDLGLNLLNSGFWTSIAPEAIATDTYNVGLLFINKTEEEAYYTISNKYIIRTANSINMETNELPDETELLASGHININHQYGMSKQVGSLQISEGKNIQLMVEGLSIVALTGREYGRLSGWAFLYDEADQSKYVRWIVLKSDQETFFFPVKSVERKDVPQVYPDLHSRFSGFYADIFENAIPEGQYEIGFLFQSRNENSDYFTTGLWIITRTRSGLEFGKK